MRDGEPLVVSPTYCGLPHRITDGVPVAHRCQVLPPDALLAEHRGQNTLAVHLFANRAAAGKLEPHPGVWKLRRR
jgi:hypothetical protein